MPCLTRPNSSPTMASYLSSVICTYKILINAYWNYVRSIYFTFYKHIFRFKLGCFSFTAKFPPTAVMHNFPLILTPILSKLHMQDLNIVPIPSSLLLVSYEATFLGLSCTHVLLYPIFLPSEWTTSPIQVLSLTQIHFSQLLFILHPSDLTRPSLGVPLHPFHLATLHSTCSSTCAKALKYAVIALTVPSVNSVPLTLYSSALAC